MHDRSLFHIRHYRLLWGLLLFSFLVQAVLMAAALLLPGLLRDSAEKTHTALGKSVTILDNYDAYTFMLPVHLDQFTQLGPDTDNLLFETDLTILFEQTIDIEDTILFSETLSVPLNDTIVLDQDIPFELNVLGLNLEVAIPIYIEVPLALNIESPVQAIVPISLSVPVREELNVPLRAVVPLVNNNYEPIDVPVQTDLNVPIPLDKMIDEVGMIDMIRAMEALTGLLAPKQQ
jgi:hypothetical protein